MIIPGKMTVAFLSLQDMRILVQALNDFRGAYPYSTTPVHDRIQRESLEVSKALLAQLRAAVKEVEVK